MKPLNVRRLALDLLCLADDPRHPMSELLGLRSLDLEACHQAHEVGLLRHLVLGTLRHRLHLDELLRMLSQRPLESLRPRVLNLLRLGAFQLSCHSRIPAHAAVNESVRLARRVSHKGIANFVNGILRNLSRRWEELSALAMGRCKSEAEKISFETSHSVWLVERWIERMGLEQTRRWCIGNNREPPIDLRVNLDRWSVAEALHWLHSKKLSAIPLTGLAGIQLTRASDLLAALKYHQGFYVQSRMSQLMGELAASAIPAWSREPEKRGKQAILDLCAAPGGKSIVLSQCLGKTRRIIAWDRNQKRRHRLRGNLRNLGLDPIEIPESIESLETLEAQCSMVLVDAPCTSLGTIRRHPEIRWRRKPEDPARMAEIQLALLHQATRWVRPEGVLLYSVCSFEKEETDSVITDFTASSPWTVAELPGARNWAASNTRNARDQDPSFLSGLASAPGAHVRCAPVALQSPPDRVPPRSHRSTEDRIDLTRTPTGWASFGGPGGEDGYYITALTRVAHE